MTTEAAPNYASLGLDPNTVTQAITARLSVLERQYLDIRLRADAPGLGENSSDPSVLSQLDQLKTSIDTLKSERDAVNAAPKE